MSHNGFRDLQVYKESYKLAMEIFDETKKFPKEERYSLTDQIRRSSRAICALIGEAYRKRKYPKRFTLMMIDADAEASETGVHLDFALDCGYIDKEKHICLRNRYHEIGKILGIMAEFPEKFATKPKK